MSSEAEVAVDKPVQLPYGAEYAKSSRAACKSCKEPIQKDSLRMSVRFQSSFFDGMQDNWNHFECFWKRARKNDINEASIKGLEWLKWEDQEAIRQRIADLKQMPDDYNVPKSAIPKLDKAKTSAGKCFKCKEKLQKGEMRISYKASFYHTACFAAMNVISKAASTISGYELFDDSEKLTLDIIFPGEKNTAGEKSEGSNKRKMEDAVACKNDVENQPGSSKSTKRSKTVFGEDSELRKKMKQQTDLLWKIREELKEQLTKDNVEEILLDNGIIKFKRDTPETRIELLADCVVFGVPALCTECPNGTLRFSTSVKSYKCTGSISEFTRCFNTSKNPERHRLKISKALAEEHPFLKNYRKPFLSTRVYPESAENSENVIAEPAMIKKFTTPNRFKSDLKSSRMIVKNGCMVDSACEVANVTHVFIDPATKEVWQATLGATEVQSGRNSFYKLQLLKHDFDNTYYLFRSWGRIGTNSGGAKTERYGNDLEAAKKFFKELFADKTRNEWNNRSKFKKHPFGMNIIETEFDGGCDINKQQKKIDISKSTSKLADPIKRLLALIFDVDTMNNTMKEFEIDLDKMPLGKLSRKHLLSAYQILTDIQEILQSSEYEQDLKIRCVDASNRFYTLIPHNTGMKAPTQLNNLNIIKDKAKMLDNLLELQVAYSIIKSEEDVKVEKDILDLHYEGLKCPMEVVEQDSAEFKIIEKYVNNTHGSTHDYRIQIIDVLKVNREGDFKRFKSDIGNRQLLWHGSRISNFVGILSQGLRIAPPEAPSSGYMFGKGIYTADMVTKSAGYCDGVDKENLLILCDVALGNMQEIKQARNITRLPKDKNSVKGLGETFPDPNDFEVMEDGVKVPCGKPVTNKDVKADLLYNEYIVYDEAQIRMRYLLRVKKILNFELM